MIPAPIPADEDQRIAALRELLILDTLPEERFDRVVGFASEEFEMPIVLVSLVDSERQWFKARRGIDACETSRRDSFCGHAILLDEILVVEDALRDARFHDNPFVTGVPYLRFYAGAPLQLPGGATVGTLCMIDTKPRHLDATDLAILAALRRLVVDELVSHAGAQ